MPGTGARARKPSHRRWEWWCAFGVCLVALFTGRSFAAFHLQVQRLPGGELKCFTPLDSGYYCILYESNLPGRDERAVAVWAFPDQGRVLPSVDRCYLRACRVPIHTPKDTDGDGIDDVFELGAEILDPMDSGDALLDPDGDGVDNLSEYRQGRNPDLPAVPDVGGDVCLDLFTPLDSL